MPITKLRKINISIKIKQTTINKFFKNLPNPKKHSLLTELERRNTLLTGERIH